MLPPLVTADDLQARLPSDWQAGDATRVEAAIEDASALVRDTAGVTWVVDGVVTDLPDLVRTIVIEVARRSLNRSFVYGAEGDGAAQEVGGLYLKGDERARLLAAVELPPAPTFGSARLSSPPLFGYTT